MTKIPEGVISKGGPCHCGKVGLYAVPRHGMGPSAIDFFCGEHKEEAEELMRKVHGLSSMRRERIYDAAVDHHYDEDSRDLSKHTHDPFKRGELSRNE